MVVPMANDKTEKETIVLHKSCPICGCSQLEYEFIVDKSPVCQCKGCSLMFINPQSRNGGVEGDGPAERSSCSYNGAGEDHRRNAVSYLERLRHYGDGHEESLLLIGPDNILEQEARGRGFTVDRMTADQFAHDLPDAASTQCCYDACILFSALEKFSDPEAVLRRVKDLLRPNGSLMVIYPSLDSWSARLFRSKWWEFCQENLFYFDTNTLQNLLLKVGYEAPVIFPDYRNVSLNYAETKLKVMRKGLVRFGLATLLRLAPKFTWDFPFRLWDSRKIVISRPKLTNGKTKLSVIVPVFNEKATFSQLIERVLAKEIPNVEMEVVIVESNSTDGSREDVLKYRSHPKVKVILEDRPRGKGCAVRTGLASVSGDVVLIQDADLEYDINDYDALIEPIVRHQQCFVIGSRHVSDKHIWKVREFNDAPLLSAFFNFGHLIFLRLFNFMYRQSLKDPFSMFKVFRRECLYGLSFECNRFDFDFEIVIKLLRKGYRPVELPVNYRARSLHEGKKISVTRDPFTWLYALLKFRFSRLYKGNRAAQPGTEPAGSGESHC